jgi:hypothetical protein
MANVTLTNITPPRVPLLDPKTGLITREWYRFFFSLFTLTGGGQNTTSLTDLQLGPPAPTQENITEIIVDIKSLKTQPTQESALEQIAELWKQIDALQSQPRDELGTMAALQQDNVPWLRFDTTPTGFPTGAAGAGSLYWDDADRSKTLALVMEDTGNIIQDIGEETFYRVKATSAITKGQVVMFTGTVGASGGLLAAPATGLTSTQSEYIMGIATQNIALNAWGYVTWFGEVDKVNTTGGVEAWVDGQILYYNPAVAGGLTKTVPTAPNPKVIVASVVHAASNGILFVRPTFGSALGATDSNVEIAGLVNGDLLQYDSVQARWENVPASTVIAGTSTAPVTKTANFTVAAGEKWLINNKSGSSCVVTLPTPSTNTGRELNFQNYQNQTLVSASSNVVPLAGGSAGTAILQAMAGANATLVSDGTSWIMTKYDSNNSLELE